MTEKLKLALVVLLVAAGVAAFYVMADVPLVLRLLALLGGIILAGVMAWRTESGRTAFAFTQEAIAEARRVVWPTRKETLQTTAAVFGLVVVMAIFLWGVDVTLMWVVKLVMGRSA